MASACLSTSHSFTSQLHSITSHSSTLNLNMNFWYLLQYLKIKMALHWASIAHMYSFILTMTKVFHNCFFAFLSKRNLFKGNNCAFFFMTYSATDWLHSVRTTATKDWGTQRHASNNWPGLEPKSDWLTPKPRLYCLIQTFRKWMNE